MRSNDRDSGTGEVSLGGALASAARAEFNMEIVQHCYSSHEIHDMQVRLGLVPAQTIDTAIQADLVQNTIRVLTLNTWYPQHLLQQRLDDLVRGILLLDPDVICLQELAIGKARQHLSQHLESRYHITVSNQSATPYPRLAYAPMTVAVLAVLALGALFGCSWTALCGLFSCAFLLLNPHTLFAVLVLAIGHGTGVDMAGLMVLTKRSDGDGGGWDRVELLDDRSFPHHIRGARISETSNWHETFSQHCFARKGFLTVQCSAPGRELVVTSVHLIDGLSNPARVHQMQLLKTSTELLKTSIINQQIASAGVTSIICGDLNTEPDTPEVQLILKGSTFVDAGDCATEVHPHRGFHTWDQELNPWAKLSVDRDCRMDYCFVDQGVVKRCERVFDGEITPFVSDHMGLLSTIELPS